MHLLKGFSLIELMATIGIAVILCMAGFSVLSSSSEKTKVSSVIKYCYAKKVLVAKHYTTYDEMPTNSAAGLADDNAPTGHSDYVDMIRWNRLSETQGRFEVLFKKEFNANLHVNSENNQLWLYVTESNGILQWRCASNNGTYKLACAMLPRNCHENCV